MKDKAQLNKSYNCTPKIYIYKSYKNKKYKQNTIKMLEQSHINKKKNSKKKKIKQLPSFFFQTMCSSTASQSTCARFVYLNNLRI